MSESEPKAHLKKMRLQLFDQNMGQLEDRLVSQDTELYKGPSSSHEGPIKIEVCLFEEEDIEKVVNYINQLTGKLPISSKIPKPKKLKNTSYDLDEDSWRETLLKEIIELTTQDEITKRLREEGFIFMTADNLEDLSLVKWNMHQDHLREFQWMIKLIKEAKNPLNNKYDPTLLFGFKLLGEKSDQIYTLLHGEASMYHKDWKSKNKLTFKKTDMCKFPNYMVLEEREKFRLELYKARKDFPNHTFSKFFKRWYKDVDFREKEEWSENL